MMFVSLVETIETLLPKLAIKIINRLNKLAKRHGIQQRRTYVKEVKNCRLSIRHVAMLGMTS
jgi:hypothetical protein